MYIFHSQFLNFLLTFKTKFANKVIGNRFTSQQLFRGHFYVLKNVDSVKLRLDSFTEFYIDDKNSC